ncbi:hypothetical protein KAH37_03735 [bacterium]|nr:hypothetical protein [bacterium]
MNSPLLTLNWADTGVCPYSPLLTLNWADTGVCPYSPLSTFFPSFLGGKNV